MNIPTQTYCLGDKRTDNVKQIQNGLNRKNPDPVEIDGIFGYFTQHAVMAFQNNYCDLYGLPLRIDGEVGPLTWGALFGHTLTRPFADAPLVHETIRIARGEIGIKEVPPGSNNGPRVKEYLRSVGLTAPKAWCAGYVFWCFDQASARQNRMNPLVKSGFCLDLWFKNRVGEKLDAAVANNNPELIVPGSIFIINRGNVRGHTGFVTGILDDMLFTIEGNTNNMQSAEGEGVYALRRLVRTVNLGYLFYN